jgi:L,D-transpeptidase catalytic domain
VWLGGDTRLKTCGYIAVHRTSPFGTTLVYFLVRPGFDRDVGPNSSRPAFSRPAAGSGMRPGWLPSSDIGDSMISLVFRLISAIVLAGTWTASAAANPLARGPLADFLNLFQQQPVARQVVTWRKGHAPGTVVISTGQRRLYYVLGNSQAIQYGVGVGREGFSWSGTKTVTMKREWPDWRPPSQMLRRRPDLPRYMAGGMDNPLGARALYLGSSLYRIHGSNEPDTIGAAVSSGCIRMTNRDVTDLYDRVRVGTKVVVLP